ncbi:MAG: TIGR02266 family protein [Sandaracinaceae bacterium]|nr:TIGR02266 family protein [Sandaracinaceae bacterium]
MAADTRKEKRAPVSLKVRFKSATVDEFIEQYSVDISTGGLFIKTKSPMPIGTLLKFEFQLKDESRLIHGVGRVVWKRDETQAKGSDIPAGMGIKFIKMDPESRALVDKIISQRGDVQSSFDMVAPEISTLSSMPPAGPDADGPVTIRPAAPAIPSEAMRTPHPSVPPALGVPKGAQRYKNTLAFDASVLPTPGPRAAEAPQAPEPPPASAPFFPSTTQPHEMPDEADRTNVRPASEIRARAEAAEAEARQKAGEQEAAGKAAEQEARQKAEMQARLDEARTAAGTGHHEDEEDAGRVTLPETDVRRAARVVPRTIPEEDQRAILRKAAEDEARAERKAAAQRADVSHGADGVQTATPRSQLGPSEDTTEAPTLPPSPMDMPPEPVATPSQQRVPSFETASSAATTEPDAGQSLPPLDFDDSDSALTPIRAAEVADDAAHEPESVEPRSSRKKKKKKRRGESVNPPAAQTSARVSSAPRIVAPAPSTSSAIERASADRKGPRLALDEVQPKKSKASSKTLPMVLAVLALAAAVGVYFWQDGQSSQPPSPIAETPIPTPEIVPPSEIPAAPSALPPEPVPAVAVETAPVRVDSVPSGATIRYADADHGVTPATLDLPVGTPTAVTVAAPGYAPLTQEITAAPGATPVRFALVAMPYSLIIDTVPTGARVTANGRRAVAPTTLALGRVTQPVVVTATSAGFDPVTQTINVGDFTAQDGQMVYRATLMLPPHVVAPPAAEATPRNPPPPRSDPPPRVRPENPPAETPPPAAQEEVPPQRPEPEPERPAPPPERPAPPPAAEPLPENPF